MTITEDISDLKRDIKEGPDRTYSIYLTVVNRDQLERILNALEKRTEALRRIEGNELVGSWAVNISREAL